MQRRLKVDLIGVKIDNGFVGSLIPFDRIKRY